METYLDKCRARHEKLQRDRKSDGKRPLGVDDHADYVEFMRQLPSGYEDMMDKIAFELLLCGDTSGAHWVEHQMMSDGWSPV